MTDLTEADMKDLPDQIPLPLVIGTEVTGELVALCLFIHVRFVMNQQIVLLLHLAGSAMFISLLNNSL